MTVYDYVAFGAMAVVFVALIWLIIALGDLPANIAKERNHPQVPAVRAMSWFGLLFTGGILWILAIVWAYFDSSALFSRTKNNGTVDSMPSKDQQSELERLRQRMETLEAKLDQEGAAS